MRSSSSTSTRTRPLPAASSPGKKIPVHVSDDKSDKYNTEDTDNGEIILDLGLDVYKAMTGSDRFFGTLISLEDHDRDRHGSPSGQVKRSPTSSQVVDQLTKNNGNRYCGECRRSFADTAALTEHLQSVTHASEFRCCDCEREFGSTKALMQHLQDKSSGIHGPARTFSCAAGGAEGGSCSRCFGSPAAMLQHLESGACPSGMDRQKLNLLVLRSDREGLVSSPAGAAQDLLGEATRRLGEATASGDAKAALDSRDVVSWRSGSSTSGVIQTPSSGMISPSLASPILTPASGYSSALAVPTRGATRCPLCPPTRRPFPTPQSLQQHLKSPAHDAQIFHCPVSPLTFTGVEGQDKATVKWFSTVSGMGQHVESGACVTGGPGFAFEALAPGRGRKRGAGTGPYLIGERSRMVW
ncbi:hypothetical protein B0T18DRAFT_429795 [Schizothecium vesticola]|uniref:C2H2-type domain-containing protein n=1 Tax=Schizothecium vesticola TaxID=314040 RepID=A0AA40EWM2_9PEZI|nr:hypothetical protein B0T18DRAFT_429795 [Schizothecium vesticola]